MRITRTIEEIKADQARREERTVKIVFIIVGIIVILCIVGMILVS